MDLTLFISPEHRQDEDFTKRFAEHVEQVRVARDAGFDGVAIGNHLSYSSSAWFPPMETLMGLAAAAEGMTLSTCMLVLPMYHPLHVAQQAALLDIVTGGRFTLGVAQGWQEEEFKVLGIDFRERLGRFRESVTLMQRLWTEESRRFRRQVFPGRKLTLVAQARDDKPRPPMWFGGSVAKAVERAAALADTRLGDSWVASSHLTEDGDHRAGGCVSQGAGRGWASRCRANSRCCATSSSPRTRRPRLREAGPFIAESYRIFGQWGLFTNVVGSGKEQLDFEELMAGRVVIGSPEEVAEELVRLAGHRLHPADHPHPVARDGPADHAPRPSS